MLIETFLLLLTLFGIGDKQRSANSLSLGIGQRCWRPNMIGPFRRSLHGHWSLLPLKLYYSSFCLIKNVVCVCERVLSIQNHTRCLVFNLSDCLFSVQDPEVVPSVAPHPTEGSPSFFRLVVLPSRLHCSVLKGYGYRSQTNHIHVWYGALQNKIHVFLTGRPNTYIWIQMWCYTYAFC